MLITLDDLKTHLGIDLTDTSQDAKLTQALEAADLFVKTYCKRKFEYGTYTHRVRAINGYVYVYETPIESVVYVKNLDGDELTIDRVLNDIGEIKLIECYNGYVDVQYIGGYSTIPADLFHATLRVAEYFFTKPEGIQSANVGGVSTTFKDMEVKQVLDLYKVMIL